MLHDDDITLAAHPPAGHPVWPAPGSYWVKSSLSFANGNCVEVAGLPDGNVAVRSSRDTAGPVLTFTRDEWRAFLGGARNGEFDRFAMRDGGIA